MITLPEIPARTYAQPAPPMMPVLNLLADGPQTAAYLYAHSGLNGETGAAIARAVHAGYVRRVVKSRRVGDGCEGETIFALLPGALMVLRDEAAIAGYLRQICPEIGPAPALSYDDSRRTRLALLIREVLSEHDPDPPAPRRDWSEQ